VAAVPKIPPHKFKRKTKYSVRQTMFPFLQRFDRVCSLFTYSQWNYISLQSNNHYRLVTGNLSRVKCRVSPSVGCVRTFPRSASQKYFAIKKIDLYSCSVKTVSASLSSPPAVFVATTRE
jgi:hypothetical protein